MIKKILIVLFLSLIVFQVGCSSTNDTSEEEAMMDSGDVAEDSEGVEDSSGDIEDEIAEAEEGDASGDDFEDEPDSEEFADEDAFGDEEEAEDLASDDFDNSEEGFGEESADDELTAEDGSVEDDGLAPLGEDGIAEEELAEENAGFEESMEPTSVGDSGFGPSVKIENIKFLANESGGTIAIDASGPMAYQSRVNSETNQFVIDIENVELPESLKRPYILKEFPQASFGAINAYQDPGSSTARVVVQMKGTGFAEPTLQAEGNSLFVIPSQASDVMMAEEEVEDLEPQEAASAEEIEETVEAQEVAGAEEVEAEGATYDVAAAMTDEKVLGKKSLDEFLTGNSKFYGSPLSIQVKDADIRDVLNFISGESGINMIIAEDVQGTITLKLREIPWDQALVTVMKAKGLGYVREGSVIRIATLAKLQAEAQEARSIIEAQRTLAPLKVRVLPVSYAVVSDLASQITPFLTNGRGNVVFDDRTSSLIVTDTDEVLNKVQRLVAELDVAPAQVMIEAKIVEAIETFSRSMGINWAASGADIEVSGDGGVGGSAINMSSSLDITNIPQGRAEGLAFSQGLEIGTLEVLGDLTARLALAESDQVVNVISSPRIVTMNKTPATITQDSQVVAISTVVNQGVTTRQVTRDPVKIELLVTPQITAAGSVILDLKVTRQFAGSVVDAETQARPINSREAGTRILVKNGQTAVLGGLYNSSDLTTEEGAPWIKDIPVLGWLFKSKQLDREKNELIFFLTPRILNLQEQSPSQKKIANTVEGESLTQ